MTTLHMVLPFVHALIVDYYGNVLIGQNQDIPRKPYPLRWDLPGGKLENFETVQDCLIREVEEETGFDVSKFWFKEFYHHFGNDPECTNDLPGLGICFKVEVVGSFNPTEMLDMHWANKEDLRSRKFTPWSEFFLREFL